MEETELKQTQDGITFRYSPDGETYIDLLKLSPDGFYYKEERVDDIHKVYENFNEWIILAQKGINTMKI